MQGSPPSAIVSGYVRKRCILCATLHRRGASDTAWHSFSGITRSFYPYRAFACFAEFQPSRACEVSGTTFQAFATEMLAHYQAFVVNDSL